MPSLTVGGRRPFFGILNENDHKQQARTLPLKVYTSQHLLDLLKDSPYISMPERTAMEWDPNANFAMLCYFSCVCITSFTGGQGEESYTHF